MRAGHGRLQRDGPVWAGGHRVLDDVGEGRVTVHVDRFDDHALVELTHHDDEGPQTWSAFMTATCGSEPIELVAPTDRHTQVRMIEQWVTVLDKEDDRIEVVTDFGAGPRHEIATEVIGCPIPLHDGMAFERSDGTVWFHPAPGDPTATPEPLLEGSYVAETAGFTDLDACQRLSSDIARDGESNGLLVLTAERSIVRVSPDEPGPTPVLAGPVRSFEVLSNPRYIAWRREADDHRLIHDRDTGFDLDLGQEIHPSGARGRFTSLPGERWVTYYPPYHNAGHVDTVLIDLESVDLEHDQLPSVGLAAQFHGSLTPTRLMISQWGQAAIYDTESNEEQWLDMPPPGTGRTEAGWVGHEFDLWSETVTVHLLPSDGGPVEILGEDLDFRFSVTDHATLVGHAIADDDPHGPLMLHPRNGAPTVIAERVVDYQLLRKSDTPSGEHEELFYVMSEGERAGLWRYELP
ncbi:MAG: hypothetical protein AAF799_43070 [Myxococcota bacterium]